MSTNTALDQIKARTAGHTEGPLLIDDEEQTVRVGYAGEILFDRSTRGRAYWLECRPTAELIAAAPKLLAALEAVEALLAEKYKLWAAVCSETCVKDHHGIDHEAIADNIATNIRAAIDEVLR